MQTRKRHTEYMKGYRLENPAEPFIGPWKRTGKKPGPKRSQEEEARRTLGIRLRRRYGITVEEYEQMHVAAGGCCQICGIERPLFGKNRLVIDHCHKTGVVRGLLCDGCNNLLGMMECHPERVERAAQYLHSLPALLTTEFSRAPRRRAETKPPLPVPTFPVNPVSPFRQP